MSIWQWIGNGFLMTVGLLLIFLFFKELRHWRQALQAGKGRRAVHMRLLRRTLGSTLLLAIVVLLKFPSKESLSEIQLLVKLLLCLGLCMVVLAVAVWDLSAERLRMQLELEEFGLKSAQELQRFLAEVQKEAPSGSEVTKNED